MKQTIIILLAILSTSCVGTTVDEGCSPGSELCWCYNNGTCDSGLDCLSGLCVIPGGDPDVDIESDIDYIDIDKTERESSTESADRESEVDIEPDSNITCNDEDCPGASVCNIYNECEVLCLDDTDQEECASPFMQFSTMKFGYCQIIECKSDLDCFNIDACRRGHLTAKCYKQESPHYCRTDL